MSSPTPASSPSRPPRAEDIAFYGGRRVLVTGGTGMIGQPLVAGLLAAGAEVRIAALDDSSLAPESAEYVHADLREFSTCLELCEGMEMVFHLAGVKGSPAMTATRPATFFVPNLSFSLNMMEAARRAGVERYLYTSTVGVYAPAEVFKEDDVWTTFPSEHDWFAGWAKRMGELQAEAYRIEYGWEHISIVRPANVYGPHDNFHSNGAMVITALIKRAMEGENPLLVWGDGSARRDFIHARDVASGMLRTVAQGISKPLNLGSGSAATIREVVEIIVGNLDTKPRVIWDTDKPTGDRLRMMDVSRARDYGIEAGIPLEIGIRETMDWYAQNRDVEAGRYSAFNEEAGKA